MEGIYRVVNIEGKGSGCIALQDLKKGTLVLDEKPQCIAKKHPDGSRDLKSVIQSFQISKLSVVLLTEPTNNKRHQIIENTRICQREIQMQKQILNIAKGTTDPRVEFILPK